MAIPKNCNNCFYYSSAEHACLNSKHPSSVGNCDCCVDWLCYPGVWSHYNTPVFIDWDINVRSFECHYQKSDVKTVPTVIYG